MFQLYCQVHGASSKIKAPLMKRMKGIGSFLTKLLSTDRKLNTHVIQHKQNECIDTSSKFCRAQRSPAAGPRKASIVTLDSQIHFNFSDAFAAERQHSARSLKLESQSHGHGCRRPRSRVHAGSSRQHGGMAAIRARGTADWDSHPGHGGPSSAPQSPPLRRGAVHRWLAGGTVGTFSMAVLSPTGCLCQCICSGRSGARSPG